jgi:alpha-L-arabinofuranosidase
VDLIQYCNGDTNTTWGALRAANGHSAPYNLKYLEIGNENGGSYYDARYTLFYDAIKPNYPNIQLISPGNWSGGPPTSRPRDISDEHYYSDPGTFIGYATKYDSYSRSGPKVFVGEYAVTSGYGTYGNLSAALGEAAFMTGMERNSDIVEIASYAPLFANVNGIQWHPDLIYYDNSRAFGTPSYYVQQMFANNRGDCVLPNSITINTNASSLMPHGAIGLGSWNTSVQYTNITVVSNGVTLYQSDFVNQGTNGWRVFNGTWNTNAGVYQQTAQITDCYSTCMTSGSTSWANYTISLQAKKTGGSEGFLILFNYLDDNNWIWWNIGGWNNTYDAIQQMVGGSTTASTQVAQTIANNTWYYIRIVVTGARAQCYLGINAVQAATNLVQDVTLPASGFGIYASTTYNQSSGQVIIKAVNPYASPMATAFNLAGVNSISPNATVIQLTSGSPSDENSFAAPAYVSPVTNSIASAGTNFTLTLPANSLSVIRLAAGGINNYTNLSLQVPSPTTNGTSIASTVWGQQSGNWINLTANTNHAIVWSSANTNVAVVDIYGNVTGVGSGTANIIASYPALGLTATQAVQVVYVPVALVHRYSFSETNGSTTVADSIGGAAWNGTVNNVGTNGGTFANGQLILSSSSQQYVNLPAGILSNYTAVTIELWASFPSQLPSACFLFGFGNISGISGTNYIFCQPEAGRIAITPSDWHGEQDTSPNPSGNWSGLTNLHVTAVFNPPQGSLALYTNGVLAAVNNSITVPMSSVNDLFSFIGRSLYSGDSYLNFNLDEFRIYNGALSAGQIAATDALGANQLLSNGRPGFNPPTLASGQFTLTWPLNLVGYTLMSCTNLAAGDWQPVTASAAQIIGSNWQQSVSLSAGSQFFRLQK